MAAPSQDNTSLLRSASGRRSPHGSSVRDGGKSLTLLILQRHPAVARAWARYLDAYYGVVDVLHATRQVTERLAAAKERRFDVVTGNWFGEGQLSGSASVTTWRRAANLRHVLIATALPPDTVPEGVLAVVRKPCGPEALLRWLQPAHDRDQCAA